MIQPFTGRLQISQHGRRRPDTGLNQSRQEGPLTAPARSNERVERVKDDKAPGPHATGLPSGDGTPVWHFPARFSLGPVVADDTVYVSDHTMVYAVPA
jgi:hypothetical protein